MLRNKIDQIVDNELNYLQISKSLLEPCFVFNLNEDNKERKLSKFGGNPTSIGEFNLDKQLSFLGQIQMSQFHSLEKKFPKNGILYFFLNNSNQSYPLSQEDYKTIFVENINPVLGNDLTGHSIKIEESYTVPSYQESILSKYDYVESHLEDLEEITNETNCLLTDYEYDFCHQLLGHPQATQGTVRFWWAIRHLNFEEKENYSHEEIEKIQAEENNFILLLQVNFGDPKIEIDIFGDAIGYFGIHVNDLKSRSFDNTILVIQST